VVLRAAGFFAAAVVLRAAGFFAAAAGVFVSAFTGAVGFMVPPAAFTGAPAGFPSAGLVACAPGAAGFAVGFVAGAAFTAVVAVVAVVAFTLAWAGAAFFAAIAGVPAGFAAFAAFASPLAGVLCVAAAVFFAGAGFVAGACAHSVPPARVISNNLFVNVITVTCCYFPCAAVAAAGWTGANDASRLK
jgi:hypothetical protein